MREKANGWIVQSCTRGALWIILISLATSLTGCFLLWRAAISEEVEVKLEEKNPLKGSMTDMRTLAVAHPAVLGLSPAAAPTAVAFVSKLQASNKFKIITPNQFQITLTEDNKNPFRGFFTSMTKEEMLDAIKQAGQLLKADGIVLVTPSQLEIWTVGIDGRGNARRRVSMQVNRTDTGKVVWEQTVIAKYHADDVVKEDQGVYATLLETLVDNLVQTAK